MSLSFLDSHPNYGFCSTVFCGATRLFPVLLLYVTAPVVAREYSLGYGCAAEYEVNDNVNLSSVDKTGIHGLNLSIPITLSMRTERLETVLAGDFVFTRFNEEAYDSNDQYLNGRSEHLFEKSEWVLFADYARTSTRTTEFLDTGVVGNKAIRVEDISVGSEFIHSFTELDGFIGDMMYKDVKYGSDLYQDYRFFEGHLGWAHRRNDRTRLLTQLYGSSYENRGEQELTSDSVGFELGLDYEIADKISAQLLGGWVWTEVKNKSPQVQVMEETSENAPLIEGILAYSGERYGIDATIGSRPSASGGGFLRNKHQLTAAYHYYLDEYTKIGLGVTLGRSEALNTRIEDDRDYAAISLRVEHRFTSDFSVAASYSYSYQKQGGETAPGPEGGGAQMRSRADSNAVTIGLIYKPVNKVLSR
jgi:opacity protein-like surface antigen